MITTASIQISMNPRTRIISVLVLAATLAGALDAFPADEEAPNPRRRPQVGGEDQRPGPRGPRFQQGQFQPGGFQGGRPGGMGFEAVLTEEQREKFGDEMFAQRQRMRELNESFGKLRRELDEAMVAEKLDESLVRQKSKELSEIEVERALIRARAFAKIRPMLSQEQMARLKEMRAEMGRGPQGGPGEFRGPQEGGRQGQRRPQGPPAGEGGDDVLPPPRPPSDREK